MNFILNSLSVIVAFCFFTVAITFGLEIYEQHKAVDAGLQQCKIGNEILWKRDCN